MDPKTKIFQALLFSPYFADFETWERHWLVSMLAGEPVKEYREIARENDAPLISGNVGAVVK